MKCKSHFAFVGFRGYIPLEEFRLEFLLRNTFEYSAVKAIENITALFANAVSQKKIHPLIT